MSRKEKEIKKTITKNAISLRTFASRYYDVKDSVIAQMTHDEFSTFAEDNHIEVQRVPFSIIKREALERNIIIVVKDVHNQQIPFLSPEYVKANDYRSLLELQLDNKYKCDLAIDRLSCDLLGLHFDELPKSHIRKHLIMMGIRIYNLENPNFKTTRKIMTYQEYCRLDLLAEEYEQEQAELISKLIEEEYEKMNIGEEGTWCKTCDSSDKENSRTKKRGKS
jgi:hypothetical protein